MPINVLLKCHDLETTKSFYKEILGFEVKDTNEHTCTVKKEDCTIIFTSDELWSGYPKCTGTIYLFINDIDTYYESIKEKAIVLWPFTGHATRNKRVRDQRL